MKRLAEPPRPTHSYIGRAECGCAVSVVADWGERRLVSDSVARMIRDGLTVERVTHDWVREHFGCTCPKPVQEALPLAAGSGRLPPELRARVVTPDGSYPAPEPPQSDLVGRARWREEGRLMHLVAARGDGGAVLATIDTSDNTCYRYTLHDGRTGAGWPLSPVQRQVRRHLREPADTPPNPPVGVGESS